MRFDTFRRWPSLISITSSVGTSTSKILSCMSMDSTRLRRLVFTFSSWPEYAWTTYQRASVGAATSLMAVCRPVSLIVSYGTGVALLEGAVLVLGAAVAAGADVAAGALELEVA